MTEYMNIDGTVRSMEDLADHLFRLSKWVGKSGRALPIACILADIAWSIRIGDEVDLARWLIFYTERSFEKYEKQKAGR